MTMWLHRLLALGTTALALVAPLGDAMVVQSRAYGGAKVEYKEVKICETTRGVKAYSGYVTLPAGFDISQQFESKMFFLFFEARKSPSTAPFAIWLEGGPGSPSVHHAMGFNGPCIVTPDSQSTVLNKWSWNDKVNMLYIDQPVQTGFSYDTVTPGAVDMLTGEILPGTGFQNNYTVRTGKFSSQDPAKISNTTMIASRAIYNFMQIWFNEFRQYKRDSISVWSESYGGHWAPGIADYFVKQQRRVKRHWAGPDAASRRREHAIGISTVGIINGFIDLLVQGPFYPQFAVNNTLGIQAYPPAVAEAAMTNFTKPGGCRDLVVACRQAAATGDPNNFANNPDVLSVCQAASLYCWSYVYAAYDALSGLDPFDMGFTVPNSFPPPYAYGYVNKESVQKALGVKVNYTQTSNLIANTFIGDGDFVRGDFIEAIGTLLDAGVHVAIMNGDRDFRCNWVGGEAVSLAVNYGKKSQFSSAGYANIAVNSSYVGGKVRQYGGFSFSRIYNAGHEVPYYQPETAYHLFNRVIFKKDVATGKVDVKKNSRYSTTGPASIFDIMTPKPDQPAPECYVDAVPLTKRCNEAQLAALIAGTAVVRNGIVVSPA